MSTVYLAADPELLAEMLAERLDRTADFFRPASIVVANRFVGKWLRLWLARKRGVAINLRFVRLEQAIWEMLRLIDPRPHAAPLDLLDHERYRLMVLSVLLGEKTDELAPLHDYLQRGTANQRASWRRLWHLADRLAGLIRDYEYHRQNEMIQHWIRGDLVFTNSSVAHLEKSQRAIFREIIREPDGKRALLGQAVGKLFKTLPQYAQELMLDVPASSWQNASLPTEPFHLFGITHISALHWQTIHWLGDKLDLNVYYLNPLLNEERGSPDAPELGELRQTLGQAAAESLRFVANLCNDWNVQPIRARSVSEERTVLQSVQHHLLGRLPLPSMDRVGVRGANIQETSTPSPPAPLPQGERGEMPVLTRSVSEDAQPTTPSPVASAESRLPQDRSLQIIACPGVYREVETVHNSIVHNLLEQPDLKQTDIAVLVTDMERYRPALQAVFDREPRRLLYNLTDFTAAGLSVFGQALIEMLDLALESFTRSRVFAVLLNPCFLARLRIDRNDALTWLAWAEALGIYHGWDEHDKKERGYSSSPFFGWQLGMRRLRLGRVMEASADGAASTRFGNIVPYADLACSDREHLDAFCRAVEGLLPVLARLRKFQGTGTQWAAEIERLAGVYLDIPPDRPEERQVRDRLVQALAGLSLLDQMSVERGGRITTYPLPIVREFLVDSLERLEGTRGEYLTGGVTISALQPFRQVPFRIIYVLGLGEDLFPGSNALPAFDLQAQERRLGDIRPAEFNRHLFMETLLAAREKIYLLYDCRELQRDQELHPSVPLVQLRRFIEENIIDGPFTIAKTPLSSASVSCLKSSNDLTSDVGVNYCETERILAALEAQRQHLLNPQQVVQLQKRLADAKRTFTASVEGGAAERRTSVPTISIHELQRFLMCPAEAAIQRHLQLRDETERDDNDDEPFLSDWSTTHNLKRQVIEQFLTSATGVSVDAALAAWPDWFRQQYEEWQLRCRAPENPFGAVDQAALRSELEERINGDEGLAEFVRQRAAFEWCGPILIGESLTPIGARTHFPALTLSLNHNVPLMLPEQVRIVGSLPLVWRSKSTVELLVLHHNEKVKEDELSRPMLEPVLFFLALKASEEGKTWVGRRALHVHIAHPGGVVSVEYLASDIMPAAARDYLRELAADFLDAGAFDLLPFALIARKELAGAFQLPAEEAASLADDFASSLQDAIEEDADSDYPTWKRMRLLEIVEAQVPGDAFAKVRRRFCLLDRGPARNRKKATAQEEDGERARKPRKARRS